MEYGCAAAHCVVTLWLYVAGNVVMRNVLTINQRRRLMINDPDESSEDDYYDDYEEFRPPNECEGTFKPPIQEN